MTREDVLLALKTLEGDLRRRHVAHAGVFGSQARGDARPESDIDVVIRFDPEARISLWDYAGVKRYISVLLRRRFRKAIDVVDLGSMKPYVRSGAERDAVYAF